MKSVIICAMALMAILLTSCNKEVPAIPAGSHKKLVRSAFSGYYKDTTTYEYDVSGRLLKVNGHEDDFSFTYTGDNVKLTDFRPGENRMVYTGNAILDAFKKITSLTGDAAYVVNAPYHNNIIFEYDDKGYLQKKVDTRNNGKVYTYVYKWINGDLVQIDCQENGVLLFYNVLEYSATTDLREMDVRKFLCETTDLTGVNSKHLLKKLTAYFADNSPSSFTEYSYVLDGQGYPATGTMKSSFGDLSTMVFTYSN